VTIFYTELGLTGSVLRLDDFDLSFALWALVLGCLHPLFDAVEAVGVRTFVELGSVVLRWHFHAYHAHVFLLRLTHLG